MTTELISFRLSNADLEWLREQCQPGESLNLAAKRLLLSLSPGVDNEGKSVNSYINSLGTQKLEEIESRLTEEVRVLQTLLDKRFEEVESRLKKLKA